MRILSGDSSDIVKIKGLKIIDFRIFETVYKSEKITKIISDQGNRLKYYENEL